MKKVLLLVFFLPVLANTVWSQSQRLLLIEEFTQASCPSCATQNPAFNTLLNANTTKAASIKYQVNWPGYDPMNIQNPYEVQARVTYTGAASIGVPFSVNDGATIMGGNWVGDPGGLTQGKIDAEYAVVSPFTIELTHWFNTANDSIFIKCKITCTKAVSMTSPNLRLAMLEKNITFLTPPGSNGETNFENVMRKMYPDAYGTAIATNWTVGQTQTLNFKEQIPSYIYQKSEIATIAWIQDDGNKKIQQAAFSPTAYATGTNEIDAVNVLSVYPNPCDGGFTASFEALTSDNYNVKITNALGQIVYEETLNNFSGNYSREINISSFGKGVYMFSIANSKQEEVKKVITF